MIYLHDFMTILVRVSELASALASMAKSLANCVNFMVIYNWSHKQTYLIIWHNSSDPFRVRSNRNNNNYNGDDDASNDDLMIVVMLFNRYGNYLSMWISNESPLKVIHTKRVSIAQSTNF